MAQSLRLMTKRSQCTSEYLFTITRHNKSSISASQTRQSMYFSTLRFQQPCQSISTQLHQLQASSTSRWSRAKVESSTIRRSTWNSEALKCFSSSARVFQTSHDKSSEPKVVQPSDSQTAQPVPQILKKIIPPVHENIYTLPNFLTTTRIITAPIISYALLHSQPVLAFTLFAYSSITDLVDGWLARRYNLGTVLGSILDPFADKLLMTLTTISLYSIGTFPWWLTLIILGRDGGLLLSALYFRWISLPPPRTMTRYWDFSLPSAEVRPTEISKINTLLQFLLVADAVLLPVLPVSLVENLNLWGVFEGWMWLVAGTTIWSGLSYVFTKDAIRFIGQDKKR